MNRWLNQIALSTAASLATGIATFHFLQNTTIEHHAAHVIKFAPSYATLIESRLSNIDITEAKGDILNSHQLSEIARLKLATLTDDHGNDILSFNSTGDETHTSIHKVIFNRNGKLESGTLTISIELPKQLPKSTNADIVIASLIISLLVGLITFGSFYCSSRRGTKETADKESIRTVLNDANDLSRELEQAKRQAVESSEFINKVCHDIKTPVSLLYNYIEVNNEKIPSNISGAYKLFGLLLNDLSSIHELRNGNLQVNMELGDISTTVSDAFEIAKTVSIVKGNQTKVEYLLAHSAGFPQALTTDMNRMFHIIVTLTSNALKFSQCNSITATLNSFYVKETSFLEIDVIDDGDGISKEVRDGINTNAFSLNSERINGSGQGYSVTNKIVNRLGGTTKITRPFPHGGFGCKIRLPIEHSGVSKPVFHERRSSLIALISKNSLFCSWFFETLKLNRIIVFPRIEEFCNFKNPEWFKSVYASPDCFDNHMEVEELSAFCESKKIQLYAPNNKARQHTDYMLSASASDLKGKLDIEEHVEPKTQCVNVLVVEDTIANMTHYYSLCQDLNYSMNVAYSKDDAFFMLNSEKFDVVLVDLQLDNVAWKESSNGYDVSLLAQHTINKNTPFIAVSNNPSSELQDFLPYNRIYHFIDKTYSGQDKVRNLVSRVIKRPREASFQKAKCSKAIPNDVISILKNVSPTDEPAHLIKQLSEARDAWPDSIFISLTLKQLVNYNNSFDKHLIPRVVLNIKEYFHI